MRPLWNFLNRFYHRKLILLILCAIGSCFLLSNYLILSRYISSPWHSSKSRSRSNSHSLKSPQTGKGHHEDNFSPTFQIPPCHNPSTLERVQKRKKNLTVIENFIKSEYRVGCDSSITYTTHADFRYLDNLVPLMERWNGPVSLALYCPGTDLDITLKIISYLKYCTDVGIDEWVNFHLIYDVQFFKKPNSSISDIAWLDKVYRNGTWKNCSETPEFNESASTFRTDNGLLYPINIARNLARSTATTYYVLASDIELYPSKNLIPSFMSMIQRLQKLNVTKPVRKYPTLQNKIVAVASSILQKFRLLPSNKAETKNKRKTLGDYALDLSRNRRHVFVLPAFEVKKGIDPSQAENKEQILKLLESKNAVLFHDSICQMCHGMPKIEEWKKLEEVKEGELGIFHKAKRWFPFQLWEPFFIGTNDEPLYDERLSWDGLRDKMVSGYIMCALDYDYYILDNAFLVHKPGIREGKHPITKEALSQDLFINTTVKKELDETYGVHEKCLL